MGVNRQRTELSISDPRIALLELGCLILAASIWYLFPSAGWFPLLLALPLLIIRWLLGGRKRRNALGLTLALAFLATAALSRWASYDQTGAWDKFWILVAATLIFISLIGQPRSNTWSAALIICLVGAALVVNFLLVHDWVAQPADLGPINRMGGLIMKLRPQRIGIPIHPNLAGGMLAMLVPLTVGLSGYFWRKNHRWGILASLVLAGILGIGLLFTSSRAAWLALAVMMAIWALWLLSKPLSGILNTSQRRLFSIAILGFVLGVTALGLIFRDQIVPFATRLPGDHASAITRVELVGNAVDLSTDFLFTGGGLRAFPGLYSRYILLIPDFLYGYAHNFYLDLIVEQGILALGIVLISYAVGMLALISPSSAIRELEAQDLIRWAGMTAIGVILLHGLLDDPLYGLRASPLLFALPGLALCAGYPICLPRLKRTLQSASGGQKKILIGVGISGLLIVLLLVAQPLYARVFSNLGGVAMARVELASWPGETFSLQDDPKAFDQSQSLFSRSLGINPDDRTANHRLGLIKMMQRDYTEAKDHLTIAHREDPGHRAIIKALGYSYVWLGYYEPAEDLLIRIPEAQQELGTYAWWWDSIGEETLGSYAEEMAIRLQHSASESPVERTVP